MNEGMAGNNTLIAWYGLSRCMSEIDEKSSLMYLWNGYCLVDV